MELREKIARTLAEADGESWNHLSDKGLCAPWGTRAEAVLAIPEIAEALKAHERLIGKPAVAPPTPSAE
jgi:hypothetical protein